MRQYDITIKGELHSSLADLEEEKELVKNGVDALILEQASSRSNWELIDSWFTLSVGLLAWILDDIYQSKRVLVDLAEIQGATVIHTRESNQEILQDVPLTMKAVSAAAFYTLVPASLWIGFLTKSQLAGSILLFLGLSLPVIGVRINGIRMSTPTGSRDKVIAQKIVEAASTFDRVIAVVGVGHLPGVTQAVPDSFEVEIRRPIHSQWSIQQIKSIAQPMIKAWFILFSLYLVSSWITIHMVRIISDLVIQVLLVAI